MVAKLLLRNLLQSRTRSLFAIITVAAALLINGLFVAYDERSRGWADSLLSPMRMAVVEPAGDVGKAAGQLAASGAVASVERVALFDGFVVSAGVKLLAYTPGAKLVNPIRDGSMPGVGECALPEDLATALKLGIGREVQVFLPDGTATPPYLVTAIVRDSRLPFVIVPADGEFALDSASAKPYILAGLMETESPSSVMRQLRKQCAGSEVIAFEDWRQELGLVTESRSAAQSLEYSLARLILLIAAIGIANSVALSLVERAGQVGLLAALGVGRWATIFIFLAEAVLLCLAGSALSLIGAKVAVTAAPALVGDRLVESVLRGVPTALSLGTAASLILLLVWQLETPLSLVRKRVG